MITLFSVEANLPEGSELNRGVVGAKIFVELWNITYPYYPISVNSYHEVEMVDEIYFQAVNNVDIIEGGGLQKIARTIAVNWNRVVSDPYMSKSCWSFVSRNFKYIDFSNPVTIRISNVK